MRVVPRRTSGLTMAVLVADVHVVEVADERRLEALRDRLERGVALEQIERER